MRVMVFACAVILMTSSLLAQPAATTRPAALKERVEKVAAVLPWLVPADAMMEREAWGPNHREVYELVTSLNGDRTPDDVRPLLRDGDSKVRTLGIVLLFATERLDVLPDIARLVADHATTFPRPETVANQPAAKDWPMAQMTVGDYAKAAIEFYVKASYELHELGESGKIAWENPPELAKQMERFAARRDVKLSTAGLRVAMSRATGEGIEPLPPMRLPPVREVVAQLQLISEPRRFFMALALDYDQSLLGANLESWEHYLLDDARRLPREVRLAAVKGERALDDPDLEPGFGHGYLLEHAVDLFQASDADLLLSIEPKVPAGEVPKGPDPRYVTAAAALRPKDADAILETGLGRFDQPYQSDARATLATALALTGSERGLTKAIDWFFNEHVGGGASGLCRETFLESIHSRNPARYRLLVSRLVQDDRLSWLGARSTLILMRSVEGYLGHPLASEDEVRACPVAEIVSANDFKPLARWKKALRDTADEWDR